MPEAKVAAGTRHEYEAVVRRQDGSIRIKDITVDHGGGHTQTARQFYAKDGTEVGTVEETMTEEELLQWELVRDGKNAC